MDFGMIGRLLLLLLLERAVALELFEQTGTQDLDTYRHPELPGGTPLRLCPQSRSTDLYQVESIDITTNPAYIEDDFLFHIYGSFLGSIGYNATINSTVDCGSHCEEFGAKPGDPIGESDIEDFCEMTRIQQPLGGRVAKPCLPEAGFGLITAPGYAWRFIFNGPGWYNVTFDVMTADQRRIFCVTAEVCLRWEDPSRNDVWHEYPGMNCTWPY